MKEKLWEALALASFAHMSKHLSSTTLRWKGYRVRHFVVGTNKTSIREHMALKLADQTVSMNGLFPVGERLETKVEWEQRPTDENFIMLQLLLS